MRGSSRPGWWPSRASWSPALPRSPARSWPTWVKHREYPVIRHIPETLARLSRDFPRVSRSDLRSDLRPRTQTSALTGLVCVCAWLRRGGNRREPARASKGRRDSAGHPYTRPLADRGEALAVERRPTCAAPSASSTTVERLVSPASMCIGPIFGSLWWLSGTEHDFDASRKFAKLIDTRTGITSKTPTKSRLSKYFMDIT